MENSGIQETLNKLIQGMIDLEAKGQPPSEEDLVNHYAEGYAHFERSEYSKAIPYFVELTRLNPTTKEYWMALAMAQIRAKVPEPALTALAMASILDPVDPLPHYYSGLCYVSLEKSAEAAQAMRLTMALAREDEAHRELAIEAHDWLSQLKR